MAVDLHRTFLVLFNIMKGVTFLGFKGALLGCCQYSYLNCISNALSQASMMHIYFRRAKRLLEHAFRFFIGVLDWALQLLGH